MFAGWAAALLVLLLLLFALIIIFLDEYKGRLRETEIGRKISPTLWELMFSMFQCMTEGCGEDFIRPLVEETGDHRIYILYAAL